MLYGLTLAGVTYTLEVGRRNLKHREANREEAYKICSHMGINRS